MSTDNALTETINGTTYTVRMFGATAGSRLGLRVAKVAGPGFAAATKARASLPAEAADAEVGAVLMGALMESLASIDADETAALLKDLMAVVSVEGVGQASAVFDRHFAGRYADLVQVAVAVCRHNGFFALIEAVSG